MHGATTEDVVVIFGTWYVTQPLWADWEQTMLPSESTVGLGPD